MEPEPKQKNIETNFTELETVVDTIAVSSNTGMSVDSAPETNTKVITVDTSNVVPDGSDSVMNKGELRSSNFSSGNSGWRIRANGDVEFNNGTFRGVITAASGTIGGTTISSIALTGGIIQTTSSGKRVEINSSTNSLKFYDAAGQVIGIGTEASRAIDILLNNTINNGVLIVSSYAGNGFYYSNTADVGGRGIYIEQTNNGANNVQPCIELHHDGHYYSILIDATHASGGIYLGNSGSLSSLNLNHSGSASCVFLNNTGSSYALEIGHASATTALKVASTSTSQNDPAVIFSKAHVNEVVRITSSVNSAAKNIGLDFNIANIGAGLECAMSFSGSEWVNAAVSGAQDYKIRVLVDGVIRYIPLSAA